MTKMRALMKTAPGEGNVELRLVDVPQPKDDEVLISVKYVGICGSDVHIYHDHHPNVPPVILGHEFSGVIASVGTAVTRWKPGDRVVSELHGGACHQCFLCKTGHYFACPSKRPIGWWTNGAYADYITVPQWLLHPIPSSLSLFDATLTEPLAVCMNILRRAPVEPQSFVVVIGPGPIGILASLAAKAAGARAVALVGRDSSKNRLELASELGVDHIVNTDHQDLEAVIKGFTDGLGADLVIEAGGSPQSAADSIKAVRKLGTIAALGVGGGVYEFPWNEALFKAINIVFSFSADYQSFEQALHLLASGAVPAERLVSGSYPLESWKEAFQALENRSALKVVLEVSPDDLVHRWVSGTHC